MNIATYKLTAIQGNFNIQGNFRGNGNGTFYSNFHSNGTFQGNFQGTGIKGNFHVIQGKCINYIFKIMDRNRKHVARRIKIDL